MNWQKPFGVNDMSALYFSISIALFCLGTWGLIARAMDQYVNEVFLGMIVPLVVGICFIFFISFVHQKNPQKLTNSMIKAFAIKMIIYAIYFVVIFTFCTFTPFPFILSFAGYFLTLHLCEALLLRSKFK